MLLNEAVSIRKNGAEIWLAGIDDAHLYDCHDIAKALAPVPDNTPAILLSHTPETYAEAAQAGVDYIFFADIPTAVKSACREAFR
jgi:predicted MPP superfamily phosphohydrolase